MDKRWIKQYPAGTPEFIDNSQFSSLVELIENSFQNYPELKAFSNFGATLTYHELDILSRDFASYLQNTLRLSKGDRIAIMMPNLLQYPVALFGALRAGLIVVNVNPLYTARELKGKLIDSDASTIVILNHFASTLEKVLPETSVRNVILTKIGDLIPGLKGKVMNLAVKYVKKMVPKYNLPGYISFRYVLKSGSQLPLKAVDTEQEDIAFLQYTGGTTGISKGAILTHSNIMANIEQMYQWMQNSMEKGKEVMITPLPLYHIFSLTVNCFMITRIGGENVLITNPRDTAGFLKELQSIKFSIMTGVNTLFNTMLHHPEFSKIDFTSLKFVLGGGMAVQRAVAENWQKKTKSVIVEGYGLSETSPVACANLLEEKEFSGFTGLPLSSTEICIRDEEGKVLDFGDTGELCVRGPQVMRGYWNQPEETARVLDKDGWFATGDIAYVTEEGFVKIVDRKKDMVIVSGFNVYPNEVEEIVAKIPKVMEVAAIGIPDEKAGERIKLFIIPNDPSLTKKEVFKFCKHELTGYKNPKEIEFVEELPKTNVGKILRRALR